MSRYRSAIQVKIAELRAERDRLDQAISMLQGLIGNDPPKPPNDSWLAGMTLREGICAVLAYQARPMASADIHAALVEGGLVIRSNDQRLSVNQALHELGKGGSILKVGYGLWQDSTLK